MMEIYDHYLVFHTDPKCGEDSIDVFAFSLFVSNFIKGTSEDRVNMYSTFLKKTEDDVIEISNLQQVETFFQLFQLSIYSLLNEIVHSMSFNL